MNAFANHNLVYGDDMMMRWYTNNTAVKVDGKGNKTYEKNRISNKKKMMVLWRWYML